MKNPSNKLHFLLIAGTDRPGNMTSQVADHILKVGETIDQIEIKMVSPADFPDISPGNKHPDYAKYATKADGYMIVTPEYNHSFPGSLKDLLDSELPIYNHKPVAFAGVSSTPWGGVRAIEALVLTTRELGMIASSHDLFFPNVKDMFENGSIKPKFEEKYNSRIQKSFEELTLLTQALKVLRD